MLQLKRPSGRGGHEKGVFWFNLYLLFIIGGVVGL